MRYAIFAGIIVILAALLFIVFVGLPFHEIGQNQKAYQTIEQGVRIGEVIRIMGEPNERQSPPVPYWDWEELPATEIDRIQTSIGYRVETYFLPVTFRFSFDSQGALIGKHRYD